MSEDEWYEPMRFEIAVIEVKSACRVNHEVGETFKAAYRTPDNAICGEVYVGLHPLLHAMRINGDIRQLGKKSKNETTYNCPSRVVKFLIHGILTCNNCGRDVSDFNELTSIKLKYTKYVCNDCFEIFQYVKNVLK